MLCLFFCDLVEWETKVGGLYKLGRKFKLFLQGFFSKAAHTTEGKISINLKTQISNACIKESNSNVERYQFTRILTIWQHFELFVRFATH